MPCRSRLAASACCTDLMSESSASRWASKAVLVGARAIGEVYRGVTPARLPCEFSPRRPDLPSQQQRGTARIVRIGNHANVNRRALHPRGDAFDLPGGTQQAE